MLQEIVRIKYLDHLNIIPSISFSLSFGNFPVHLPCTQHDTLDKGKEGRILFVKLSYSAKLQQQVEDYNSM